ncbi:hypothetical protein STEG23_001490, partial [Scotinomys teguina]
IFSFVYDYEKCQLLAAPIYFREDMGIEEPADGVNFHCGKSKPLGNKVPLHRLLTVCYLKWTNRTQNKGLPVLAKTSGCSFNNRPFLRPGQNGTIAQVTFAIWKGGTDTFLEHVTTYLPPPTVLVISLDLWLPLTHHRGESPGTVAGMSQARRLKVLIEGFGGRVKWWPVREPSLLRSPELSAVRVAPDQQDPVWVPERLVRRIPEDRKAEDVTSMDDGSAEPAVVDDIGPAVPPNGDHA